MSENLGFFASLLCLILLIWTVFEIKEDQRTGGAESRRFKGWDVPALTVFVVAFRLTPRVEWVWFLFSLSVMIRGFQYIDYVGYWSPESRGKRLEAQIVVVYTTWERTRKAFARTFPEGNPDFELRLKEIDDVFEKKNEEVKRKLQTLKKGGYWEEFGR